MQIKYRAQFLSVVVVLSGSLLLSGCGKKQQQAGGPPMGPPEVGVIEVKPERVALTTELPGRTSPYLIAEVRPQVSGIILKRVFTEGSDVKAGQVLYQIDPATYQAAYASAKAGEARAEANVLPAKLKEERFRELVKINAVSKQDYDAAYAALKQAEADVASAKAAVETARINLAYTKVTAPISGRIGRSSVTDGALVTASQPTALATIQQLSTVYVDVTQSSSDMLKLNRSLATGLLKRDQAGQARVKLLLEDGTPYPVTGTLKFSDVTVDQSTGSITVRAVFPNPKQTLLPGMFVRAVLEEGINEAAILIPQRGVTRNAAGQAIVMVVGADSKVEPRPVQVARTVGDAWLVSSGLKPGEKVILEGLQKARPGTQVKVVPFQSPEGQGGPGPGTGAPAAAGQGGQGAAGAKPAAPAAPAQPQKK
ncbi:efflux RND transporter periplasmic adaptor subunit [Geomonas anaerohicana]|uniref:Efflux RND transporter periplasmic adaptor subunit n=1 Tax=Geomonas anaerohicana TaxID=2798583 RepID=A0ABS0YCK4_9BACT|nr:efflux RND transporter periplasmic adaptor subunit [Geomonas anaerohicana]MBJ6750038.1 efflux RND transporter periplasmic adaptor subunit [Geomonas anaerohicana]